MTPEQPRTSQVSSTNVRFEGRHQFNVKLLNQRELTVRLFEHGINQDNLARHTIGQ